MRWRQLLRDALLPSAIALLGAAELYSLGPDGWGYGIALESAACVLLVWRRRYPLVVCTLAAVLTLAMPWVGPQLDEPATPIIIVAVVAYCLARRLEGFSGLIGMGIIGLAVLLDYGFVDQRDHNASDLIFVASLLLPPYVLGRLTRKLAVQSEQLLRQQEWVKREAVRVERDRIARDLHDVIAHSISAMVVQTAAAQDLVRTDPDRAATALQEVAATGRRALAETGRLLHVIRDDADELGLTPAPGLAQLPELVESFRGSGLLVDLELDGSMSPLPAGVDLSAYRIVQEALTNALKYAADRATSLRLTRTPNLLSIQTENAANNGKIAGSAGGSGLGLVGMAERVSVFGGSLSHGLTGDGRFVLTATLPVTGGGDPV
jgi:signal transduction histidine kinase